MFEATVFHPDQVTGKVFSSEHAFPSFKILNLFRTLSSWGSSNYRPSAPFLYEVASHVKKTAIPAIIITANKVSLFQFLHSHVFLLSCGLDVSDYLLSFLVPFLSSRM